MSQQANQLTIYIDGDACPVKDETYKVAQRYGLPVILVANSWMRVPREDWLQLIVVSDGFDAADDYIAQHCDKNSIVITADILLADRCVKQKSYVLGHKGKPFDEKSIGAAVAQRNLMEELRAGLPKGGETLGGPASFSNKDRSNFLQALDLAVNKLKPKS